MIIRGPRVGLASVAPHVLVANGQQSEVPCPLDRSRYLPLMLRAGASPTPGANPGMLSKKGPQKPCILVVNDLGTIHTEGAPSRTLHIPSAWPSWTL